MTTTTTNSTQSVTVTWTSMFRLHSSISYAIGGWWGVLDFLGHKCKLPQFVGIVPFMRIVCDRYELAAGIPRLDLVEMDYHSKGKNTPWWLRR